MPETAKCIDWCDETQCALIETDHSQYRANYFLDATGRWQWLSRQFGFEYEYFSKKLLCKFGYVRGYHSKYAYAPMMHSDDEGWLWIAKVGIDQYQWTRMNWDGKSPDLNL